MLDVSEQSRYRARCNFSVLLILSTYMSLLSKVYKKNVATNEMFSLLIRCYSVHVPSQPCLANIERAKDVSKAHVPPELRRIARQNCPGNNHVISFQLALVL